MTDKDDKKQSAADAKKVEADHAKTGRPVSPTEDPTDHSVSAGAMAAQLDPHGRSGAAVNAKAMDKVAEADEAAEAKALAEEDKSLAGRIRKSQLYWIVDHSMGGNPYIGISPQNDPDASPASKRVSIVEPVEFHSPATGLEIRLPDGPSFTVGDGFGPGSQPSDWDKIKRPDGSPLFA